MPQVNAERMAAVMEDGFVLFLIGMRVNKPWKVHKWWPVFTAMPKLPTSAYAVLLRQNGMRTPPMMPARCGP